MLVSRSPFILLGEIIMTQSALVAYDTSELLTLRHTDSDRYRLITQACSSRLHALGALADGVVIDDDYLTAELESGGISAVALARRDLSSILGLVSARLERVGRRFCLRVHRPYLIERCTCYGVQRYEIYWALRERCLHYVLQHHILWRLDNLAPVREIEWQLVGWNKPDRYRLRGTSLVAM